jgi:diguanylate cyclase (GGDEF)-like protein
VRAHHEKWDGTGYPAGLKGTSIPVGARILAAVDCLDALLSDRYHRRAMPLEKAIGYLRSESGKSFDPVVVAILLDRYQELEARVRHNQNYRPNALTGTPAPRGVLAAAEAPPGGDILRRIAATRREEQQLFQLARELGNSLSLDETLALCALRIKSMCAFDSIAIYIRRDDKLVPEYASGDHSWSFGAGPVALGEGLAGWVAEHGTPIVNGDPADDLKGRTGELPKDLRSALVVPLEGVAGGVGVLALYSRTENAYTMDHLRVLTAVSVKAAASVENALKYSQAERSATTDALTGLPNARSLFLQLDSELARARRQKSSVSVLVCDLDGFKQVNDRYGHLEGNRVLRAVAQMLRRQCREYDFVARMGGDEFVLVLPGYPQATLGAKIEQIRLAVQLCGAETLGIAMVGLSVGASSFPESGSDTESLLAEADRHMYEMKQKTRLSHGIEETAESVDRLR